MEVNHVTAPSYEHLRPFKSVGSDTFPVYRNLVETLLSADEQPNDDVRFVMAVCSAYAYGDTETLAVMMACLGLEKNNCFMAAEHVDVLLLTSTAYLIQSRDGRVVILCYRGTPPTSLITWLTDFQVDPVRIGMGLPTGSGEDDDFDVHGGFYRNVRSTRHEILGGLKRAIEGYSVQPDGGKVEHELEALYITGHSLGGASAAMLVAMLQADPTYEPIVAKLRAVYTFGAPMIGSPEFARACNKVEFLSEKVIRYVYAHDIVPQLPPAESGRFEHFGQEYQYSPSGDGGRWHHNTAPRGQLHNLLALAVTPASFLAKQIKLTRHFPFPASISDHLPQYYIAALTPDRVRSEFGD